MPGAGRVDDAAAASALMISATAVVFVGRGARDWPAYLPSQIPGGAWPYLAAIGFAETFLAIQTFYAGSRRIGAAQAALVSTVEPLIIVTLAWIFLHETLAPIQLVGAGLIIVGVLVAQTAERPTGAAEPASPLDAEVRAGGESAPRRAVAAGVMRCHPPSGVVGVRPTGGSTRADPQPRTAARNRLAPSATNAPSAPIPTNVKPSSRWRGTTAVS